MRRTRISDEGLMNLKFAVQLLSVYFLRGKLNGMERVRMVLFY